MVAILPTAVIENLISDAPWRASNHGGPHEYVIYRQAPELYKQIQALQKTDAVRKKSFEGYVYRYVNLSGKRYWLMYPVLNRAEGEIEDEE